MSNVTLFNGDLPDYLKEVELDDVTKALSGAGKGIKRIALGANKFVLKIGSNEISKSSSDKMEIVIVNASKDISRTFYATAWDPKADASAPDCWSSDGRTPDANIQNPQASRCDGCPQTIEGSGQGKSKACRPFRKIAVSLAGDLEGDVYQMNLSSTSWIYDKRNPGDLNHMPFDQYATYVGSQGYNLNNLVTEMRFDEDSKVGKLFFRPVRFLSREEWELAKKQGSTPAAKSAISMTVSQAEAPKKLAAPEVKPAAAEPIEEPKKREEKKVEPTKKRDLKSVMSGWATDEA